jgi:outer membrane protein, multidrug efflux system
MKLESSARSPTLLVAALTGAVLCVAGCASLKTPAPASASASAAPVAAAAWQAPAPHQGSTTDLTQWWSQFNDPLLPRLIAAAQEVSPSISAAKSRIEQSRAARVLAGAALAPSLNAQGSAVRGAEGAASPATSLTAGLNAAWEIDVFGGAAAGRDAAQARLAGSEMLWHEARVSVAAEVATQYTSLRACEATLAQVQLDASSRSETARLTDLTAKAGFSAPAQAALSRASAAQGNSQLTQQRAQCDGLVKGLVYLTGADETALRTQLNTARGVMAQPAQISIPQVPAALLRQRPDLGNAERELLAASGDIRQAQAAQLPRIALNGSIGAARVTAGGFTNSDSTWSLGPLSVSLPLFDGGSRQAQVSAAQARHIDATVQYNAKLRAAVREVEDALITLKSTSDRNGDALVATEGFAASLRATDARYKGGLATLFELEDARRSAVQAQTALIDLQRERVTAWITLYRALGGGWSADASMLASTSAAKN